MCVCVCVCVLVKCCRVTGCCISHLHPPPSPCPSHILSDYFLCFNTPQSPIPSPNPLPCPGGALGVVSTFTGKLGDAAALFSRDKDERERRRSDNRELSITYGLGGLIKDFGGAVTNVVVQPVKGAQSEGVIGFLKGTGRGIFGIALRPIGGALDLTTIAVDKLKRCVMCVCVCVYVCV